MDTEPKQSLESWYLTLQEQFKNAPRESIRHYNIETLPRVMFTIENNKDSCPQCSSLFITLSNSNSKAAEWMINNDKELKSYQKQLQDVMRHLTETHKISPKGLWLSRYITIGIIAGIPLAYLLSYLFNIIETSGAIMTGAATGMIFGWIAGKQKERILKKANRLF